MRDAAGSGRQAQDAAEARRHGRSSSRRLVSSGPCKEVVQHKGFSLLDLPVLKCWPLDAGPLHHAAAGVHPQSRYGQAQLRHVPDAGLRRAHHRHALADAQAGRRALPPPPQGRQGSADARGRGHRRGPGHHVFRHPAAAAGPRRDDDRRLPAAAARWRWCKCETCDLEVPAQAEIVLEGYVETR